MKNGAEMPPRWMALALLAIVVALLIGGVALAARASDELTIQLPPACTPVPRCKIA